MPVRFVALETALVRNLQAGGADANRLLSDFMARKIAEWFTPERLARYPEEADIIEDPDNPF